MKTSGVAMRRAFGRLAVLAGFAVTAGPAFAVEGTFTHPTFKGQGRLDACYFWGRDCGKKPADTYCQVQGYGWAVRFETEPFRPTRIAGDGKVCDASFCMGFKSITCGTTAAQRGETRRWPQRIDY